MKRIKSTKGTRETLSDPLRAALRQERRLLLVICLLFGALIGTVYLNVRQAERIAQLTGVARRTPVSAALDDLSHWLREGE